MEDTEREIRQRLARVQTEVAEAARRSGREAGAVRIAAVSKRQPLEKLLAALRAGHSLFGENYVQEAEAKATALRVRRELPSASFHLIGPLQRNKVKRAVGLFDVIETVGKIELAREISKVCVQRGTEQRIFAQVNVSREPQKSGVLPEAAAGLCQEIARLPGLLLEGLMGIGSFFPADAARAERSAEFRALAELRAQLVTHSGLVLPELSMGMSSDYPLAVEEGATIVRIGTAIFGERGIV